MMGLNQQGTNCKKTLDVCRALSEMGMFENPQLPETRFLLPVVEGRRSEGRRPRYRFILHGSYFFYD